MFSESNPELPGHIEAVTEEFNDLYTEAVLQLRYILGQQDPTTLALPEITHEEACKLVQANLGLFSAILQSLTISAAAHQITYMIEDQVINLRGDLQNIEQQLGFIAS